MTLVCALVRPCLYHKVPKLAELQWAHDPARALSQEDDREGAIMRVCEELIGVPALQARAPSSDREGALDGLAPEREEPVYALQAAGEGESVGVPALPDEFVAREELADVGRALLAAGRGASGLAS